MATRDLSSTAIEGGRTGYFKAECKAEIRKERAAWRAQARAIVRDLESWDEEPDARRVPVIVSQSDKLSPIYRFLEARVGESWDDTRSELFSRFDIRTTPGRHVLFDHLLKDVRENPEPNANRYYGGRFYRDRDGVLRRDETYGGFGKDVRFVVDPPKRKTCDLYAVARWLGTDKIGRAGAGFALYVPAGKSRGAVAVVDKNAIVYACVDSGGSPIYDPQPAVKSAYSDRVYPQPPKIRLSKAPYRQDGMLSEKATTFFRSLPLRVQEMICAEAPANF
jgi:hypothetical protein